MKTSRIALAIAALGTAGIAQVHSLHANRVLSNNQPYFVICTCTHPATGVNRQWSGTVHRDYLPAGLTGGTGAGMASGTSGYKIFRARTFNTCRDEDGSLGDGVQTVHVTGFTGVGRFSAASILFPIPANPWMPRVRITGVVADPSSPHPGAVKPDFSSTIADFGPGAPRSVASTRTFRFTRTCALNDADAYTGNNGAAFNVQNALNGDFAMTYDYLGGEMDDTPNSPQQSSQSVVGTWQDGSSGGGSNAQTDEQFGWIDAAGNTYKQSDVAANQTTAVHFNKWLTFLTDYPSIALWSSWGQRRQAAAAAMRGHSLGTYSADIAGSPGHLGVSVRTSRFGAGDTFVLILDPAPFTPGFCAAFDGTVIGVPGSFAFFQTRGLSFNLAVVVVATLSGATDDDLTGPLPGFQVGPLGFSAIGAELTAQAHVIDAGLTQFCSTEARVVRVVN